MIVGIAVETTVLSKEASAETSRSATVTARRRFGSNRGEVEDIKAVEYSDSSLGPQCATQKAFFAAWDISKHSSSKSLAEVEHQKRAGSIETTSKKASRSGRLETLSLATSGGLLRSHPERHEGVFSRDGGQDA
jgi:hypothetical protein